MRTSLPVGLLALLLVGCASSADVVQQGDNAAALNARKASGFESGVMGAPRRTKTLARAMPPR